MASYFDISVSAATGLLPADVQCRSDLAFLASGAEAELIAMYTREEPDYRGTALDGARGIVTGYENLTSSTSDPRVYLRYYKADADELTSADELKFLTAMRRAIAALIRVRASQEDLDPLVRSETRGRRSVTYWAGANSLDGNIPRSVTKWLRPYDARPKTFAI